jgi:hypothetical protein
MFGIIAKKHLDAGYVKDRGCRPVPGIRGWFWRWVFWCVFTTQNCIGRDEHYRERTPEFIRVSMRQYAGHQAWKGYNEVLC